MVSSAHCAFLKYIFDITHVEQKNSGQVFFHGPLFCIIPVLEGV